MITLPNEWSNFVNTVRDRTNEFIEHDVWNITKIEMEKWRRNFRSDEEKYLAACLLDSLMYRSNRQTYSLIYQLLTHILPNLFRLHPPPGVNVSSFLNNLITTNEPGLRFVAAIRKGDNPTKSSHEVLRFIRRIFRVKDSWIITPDKIDDTVEDYDVRTFIFIDDFLGTGNQFCDICTDWQLEKHAIDKYIVYAPLTAHQKGIDTLSADYPNIHTVYTEHLNDSHSFFKNYFSDHPNTPENARIFFKKIFTDRGIFIPANKLLGWGDLELTYCFEHGFPDNSLPIFYWNKDWNPLFNR